MNSAQQRTKLIENMFFSAKTEAIKDVSLVDYMRRCYEAKEEISESSLNVYIENKSLIRSLMSAINLRAKLETIKYSRYFFNVELAERYIAYEIFKGRVKGNEFKIINLENNEKQTNSPIQREGI
jgi:hypothetical protein